MASIRGTHASPGVYTRITDISYAANTLGITSVGLVGETLKGPAFEPMLISSWTQFVQYYGSTSPERFKGSNYPKYELPYIAKEFLSTGDRLYVSKVLGLSGYNAGPLFGILAEDSEGSKYLVAVLRSKGTYGKSQATDDCAQSETYDQIKFKVENIEISEYVSTNVALNGCDINSSTALTTLEINRYNYGNFTLNVTTKGSDDTIEISVSLNPESPDYIYNVLGTDPNDGEYPLYVEEVYDSYIGNLLDNTDIEGLSISKTLLIVDDTDKNYQNVSGTARIPAQKQRKANVGNKYICEEVQDGLEYNETIESRAVNGDIQITDNVLPMEVGGIYELVQYRSGNGQKFAYIKVGQLNEGDYVYVIDEDRVKTISGTIITGSTPTLAAMSTEDATVTGETEPKIIVVEDYNDYKEGFRHAVTPWTVSELKGNSKNISLNKLFRFHTISDGNYANSEIKISIANVNFDDKTFDVYIRDFNDTDSSPIYLETYRNVTLKEGERNFIGLKIGTYDEEYEQKSKYVTIEISDSELVDDSVPCGFLGYPIRDYEGSGVIAPDFVYNTVYDDSVNERKQFFGLSDATGVDVDMLSYKGKSAYKEYSDICDFTNGFTSSFHLDYRINVDESERTISIDGVSCNDIKFQTVEIPNGTELQPIISTEIDMEDTLYGEKKSLRKFTFYPYGGFDGWDIHRTSRTNTDEYKINKYKGKIVNNVGNTFSTLFDPESLALSGKCLNTDYYAYLAGIKQFENPEKYPINVFATPGIDYVNNKSLVTEAFYMIEDEEQRGGDAIYVVTTPDKPFGADLKSENMFTAQDAVGNLEDSEIDSYYGATYYPWINYYDAENYKYVALPATKDVIRNMADVDNKKYPWWSPAGTERGNVKCTKARSFSKLVQEDVLYEGRINAIKTFAKDGVKVWGNKTMYTGDTPMNRINTVRLMIYMKKLIIEAARPYIFQPNDVTLKLQFEKTLKSILEDIKKNRGINDFKLKVSQTPEEMDAHEMNCELYIKPVEALEYVGINFIVTPNGVNFEDLY